MTPNQISCSCLVSNSIRITDIKEFLFVHYTTLISGCCLTYNLDLFRTSGYRSEILDVKNNFDTCANMKSPEIRISKKAKTLQDMVMAANLYAIDDNLRKGSESERNVIRKDIISSIDRVMKSDRISIKALKEYRANIYSCETDVFSSCESVPVVGGTFQFACDEGSGNREVARKKNVLDY